ncbi:hypothetical protein ACQJBY_067896 [Aegilops geniculata]
MLLLCTQTRSLFEKEEHACCLTSNINIYISYVELIVDVSSFFYFIIFHKSFYKHDADIHVIGTSCADIPANIQKRSSIFMYKPVHLLQGKKSTCCQEPKAQQIKLLGRKKLSRVAAYT